MALHSAEALLGFRDTERNPAADHALASPPLDVAADAPKRAVHVLDGVGRREGAAERGRQPEPQHGERLIEALAKTSGGAVFTVGVEPGGELEQQLLRDIGALNASLAPGEIGPVGAVIGPAAIDPPLDLTAANALFLAPGIGAQGAGPDDVARTFAACPDRVMPAASRSLLAAGPDPAALADAVARLNDQFRALL